jgi:hypothetical protein
MSVGFVYNQLDLISAPLQHICSAFEEVIAFDLYFEVLTPRNEFVWELWVLHPRCNSIWSLLATDRINGMLRRGKNISIAF